MKLQDFEPHVGKAFRIEGLEPSVVLAEARAVGTGMREGGAFSLVFEGPDGMHVEQGMVKLTAGDAAFDLFLVPIGPFGKGMGFEAVFT